MNNKAIFVADTNKVMSQDTRDSVLAAAKRWEADYVEITESDAPFAHHALKLHAFELCDYNYLLILDSDTIIREDAPNIFAQAPAELFCAVRNQQPHYPRAYDQNVGLARAQIEYIMERQHLGPKEVDVEWLSNNFFNSGVMVVSREHHALTFAYAAHIFERGLQWWDQIPINVAVHRLHHRYMDLGSMWNFQFPNRLDRMTAYIYHFAGDPGRYKKLDGEVNWRVE